MPRIITAITFCVFGFSVLLPVPNLSAKATASVTTSACACPFCSALTLTFAEQMDSSDITVVAQLVEAAPPIVNPNAEYPKAKFEIVGILKGDDLVKLGMNFKAQLVGEFAIGQKFLVMGTDPPQVGWTTPMKASDRVFKYLSDVRALPEKGPKRLAFFQDYFEDKESVLAFDAYDEFARAPYEDMIAVKDLMNHDQLIEWINNPDTSLNRRRLYFTMLGICGTDEDTKLLEELITSDSRKKRAGLDALIACYLMLKGESGVDLIEKTFLANPKADYVDTLSAVSALRFHGTEVDVVPKQRIVAAIRHLLDRPKMADMIIPDLARWKDWTVMERLVQMFKDANSENNWLRVPVITYLRACPKPEAKAYIEELRKIDPESVQRADFFLGFEDGDDWGDEDDDDGDDDGDLNKSTPAEPTEADIKLHEQKLERKKSSSQDEVFVTLITPDDGQDCDDPESFQIPATELNPANTGSPSQNGTFASEGNEREDADPDSNNVVPETVTLNVPAKEFLVPANSEQSLFVSNNVAVPVSPIVTTSTTSPPPMVQSAPLATPLVAVADQRSITWLIVLVPMAASIVIFLLLWSVVNGWFERLIF